ncbi:hypothetical protein B5E53_07010 [Eubacterium sp. An11]|nr:hypothetical protein B5E53_07010 [Eubacterium sp. An11]
MKCEDTQKNELSSIFYSIFVKKGIDTIYLRGIINSIKRVKERQKHINMSQRRIKMKRFESYEECMEEIERRRNSGWYQSWEGYVLELDGEYYPAKDAEERQHAMDCGWNWIKK